VLHRKSVLFLASWYPSRENKSLGNFVQRHAEAANQIADVTVIYAVSSQNAESIEFDRSTINSVDTLIIYYPKVKSKIPLLKQVLSRAKYLDALKQGYRFLNMNFDAVHLNAAFPAGLFALFLKRKYSINYVLTVHWTGYLDHTGAYELLPFYERNLHKKIFADANQVLPVSDHLGESLVKLNLVKAYEVIPNVVNEKLFFPEPEKELTPINRFLHVSSFDDKHKNVVEMLNAFKNIQDGKQDFLLHLITEGDQREVWGLIDKAGIDSSKCFVEEKATPQEVAEAMRKADCFVLFSNYETFSVVLAEAWMSGIPAIYSKCGGLTEVVNPELGVQVKKRDLNKLTKALLAFNKNDYKKENIVTQANAFRVNEIADRFFAVYDNY
jgi:glycosyltransferase involved in cell wall biosynthesis